MADAIRVDKWLWYARFFKTRTLAAKIVSGGHVRVNGEKVSKASASVAPGDVLTFPQARDIRVARVLSTGNRRGPATEAQGLYEDLTPAPDIAPAASKHPGGERSGRPSKKQRRDLDGFKRGGP